MIDHRQQLTLHAERWNKIEKRIKQAELIVGNVTIPAINEMRYAGRQIVDAWLLVTGPCADEEDRDADVSEKLIIVGQYLENADHDVTDAVCLFLHKKISALRAHFNGLVIKKYFPEFGPFQQRMDEANIIVTGSRETRRERADEYARLRDEYLPELYTLYRKVAYSEELALARKKRRQFLLWLAGGFSLFTLVSLLMGWAKIIPILSILGSIASIASVAAPQQAREWCRGHLNQVLGRPD